MKIGIIGSGRLGATAARILVRNGHVVALSNTRGPNSLGELRRDLGEHARAGTTTEVAIGADAIILALPFGRYRELPVEPFRGKLVIDGTNYDPGRDGEVAGLALRGITSSELISEHLDRARLVKSLNTMDIETLATGARSELPRDQRLALFLAGDDDDAKAKVAELIDGMGFAAVDTGSLAGGGRLQQPGSSLYGVPLRAGEAEAAVAAAVALG